MEGRQTIYIYPSKEILLRKCWWFTSCSFTISLRVEGGRLYIYTYYNVVKRASMLVSYAVVLCVMEKNPNKHSPHTQKKKKKDEKEKKKEVKGIVLNVQACIHDHHSA